MCWGQVVKSWDVIVTSVINSPDSQEGEIPGKESEAAHTYGALLEPLSAQIIERTTLFSLLKIPHLVETGLA